MRSTTEPDLLDALIGRAVDRVVAALDDRLPELLAKAIAGHEPRENLSTKQAAAYLGVSASTLEARRARGGGPRFSKLGRRVVYSREALDAWRKAGGAQ